MIIDPNKLHDHAVRQSSQANSHRDKLAAFMDVLVRDDRFLDEVLDELTERAGHPRHTDALGLARWDLSAALIKAVQR